MSLPIHRAGYVRGASGLLGALLLGACGASPPPDPSAVPAAVEDVNQPPPLEVLINGQPGARDPGFDGPGIPKDWPQVSGPFAVTLPDGAMIADVTAWVGFPTPEILDVPHTGASFGRVPDGTELISVAVTLDGEDQGRYYWTIGP